MNNSSTPNNISSRIEQRWERRQERRSLRNGGGSWILGIILIVTGGLIYLQTMKIYALNNWWALFILIPAMLSLLEAWRVYRVAEGKYNRRARGGLILGIGLICVTAMFLFGLNWTILGPALLALAGLGLIINGMLPD